MNKTHNTLSAYLNIAVCKIILFIKLVGGNRSTPQKTTEVSQVTDASSGTKMYNVHLPYTKRTTAHASLFSKYFVTANTLITCTNNSQNFTYEDNNCLFYKPNYVKRDTNLTYLMINQTHLRFTRHLVLD